MTTGKALNGKPYAGNPHVRFDDGEVASAATPRRGSLLYNTTKLMMIAAVCVTTVSSSLHAFDGEACAAEFAKYHRQITGRDAPDGMVKFAIDPKISKSGRDAYSIVSGNAAVAGRPPRTRDSEGFRSGEPGDPRRAH